MADSYALYMVCQVKPLALVHIGLWDGWDYPHATKVTLKEVTRMVAQEKALKELFAKKK